MFRRLWARLVAWWANEPEEERPLDPVKQVEKGLAFSGEEDVNFNVMLGRVTLYREGRRVHLPVDPVETLWSRSAFSSVRLRAPLRKPTGFYRPPLPADPEEPVIFELDRAEGDDIVDISDALKAHSGAIYGGWDSVEFPPSEADAAEKRLIAAGFTVKRRDNVACPVDPKRLKEGWRQ